MSEALFACGITGPLSYEAKAELADMRQWLETPKPRPEFHAWRRANVPVRVDQDAFGKPTGNCLAACIATITGLPLHPLTAELQPRDEAEDWVARTEGVLAGYGWTFAIHAYDPATMQLPSGFCILSGVAERGLRHATVGFNGELWHDPHPSRAGLVVTDRYYTLARSAVPVVEVPNG